MLKKTLLSFIFISVFNPVHAQSIKINAKYALLEDASTGIILAEKNADEKMAPASMSKLMTVYMVFNRLKSGVLSLDDKFTVSERAWKIGGAKTGGSTMFLKPKSKVSVSNLLRGVIIQSGNDACIVLAEGISGSEEESVIEMNETAARLGLTSSNFINVTGLPNKEHYMSARDLLVLTNHIINDFPELYSIFKETQFTYNHIKQENRNPLLYIKSLKGIADGLKTGHTEKSGYGLVGSAKTGDRRISMVINGLPSNKARSLEAENLINWGLKEFENRILYKKDEKVTDIPVWSGRTENVSATAEKDFLVTLPKIKRKETKIEVVYNSPLKAPLKKGDKIGHLIIKNPSLSQTQEINLLAGEDVPTHGYLGKYKSVIKHFCKQMWEKL